MISLLYCLNYCFLTQKIENMNPMSSNFALGAGCYWGTEKFIKKDFQKQFPNSIRRARVGFMSSHIDHPVNPSYRQVCSGRTGHIEVLDIEIDSSEELFEEIIRFFFMFHDPTTKDRQGNDMGTQVSYTY